LKGEITWPWNPEYTPPPNPLSDILKGRVLQVEAWVASIDLKILRSIKKPDIFWGWPVENGQRILDGVVECIRLSTGTERRFRQFGEDILPRFCNIMIIGRDSSGGTVYRRGIAQLFTEDWERFGPRREWICLR
jgi:hypothetical protein